jgi:hypothetical protein
VKLYHLSPRRGLTVLDPRHMGTSGVRSEEYRRGLPEVQRFYAYREGTPHEDIVAGNAASRYGVTLKPHEKLYDLGKDPEGLAAQAVRDNGGAWNSDLVYSKIKGAGYHGLHNSASRLPNVVALFYAKPVDGEDPV